MSSLERNLATYYDQEASRRARREIDPKRVTRRTQFADLLLRERRNRILEVGVGPGIDAAAFQGRGIGVTGVDLSAEHVALSKSVGVDAVVASVLRLPFPNHTFHAVWSMSTLMHIPNDNIDTALSEIKRVVVPGAPVALGMWSGSDTECENSDDTIEPRRFFSWRSDASIGILLSRYGQIETFDTWSAGPSGTHLYQWCIVRV